MANYHLTDRCILETTGVVFEVVPVTVPVSSHPEDRNYAIRRREGT